MAAFNTGLWEEVQARAIPGLGFFPGPCLGLGCRRPSAPLVAGSFVASLAGMPILGNQKNKQHKENKNFAPETPKHSVFPVGFGEKGSHAPGCLTHSDPLAFLSEARGQVVGVGVELAQRKDRTPSVPSTPCRTVSSGSDSGRRNVQCRPFFG